MDPFRFTIALPSSPDSIELLQALSSHLARELGMDDSLLRRATADLRKAVEEQMRAGDNGHLVNVTFERRTGEDAVTIEVADESGEPVRKRFTWDGRQSG